jgi:hypothetical protein
MGSAMEAGEVMTHRGIEAFNAVGFSFGNDVLILRQEFDVGAPAIGTVLIAFYLADPADELFACPIITISELEVEGSSSVPIISDPYPKLLFFSLT